MNRAGTIYSARCTVVLLLVLQLILGDIGLSWGQQAPRGGAKAGGGARTKRPEREEGRAAEGGVTPQVGVTAQTPTEEQLPGGQALSRAVGREEYVLGPGDGLVINIWGEHEQSFSVKVTPDGKISLSTIGDLDVNGLTLAKADALIDAKVKKYYKNVKSGVSLTSLRVFQVLVLGWVEMPGGYLATPVKRVSEVVSQAGGVLAGGSQRHIQLRRGGQVDSTVDLYAFLRNGDESANPFLQDGDVIFVPSMQRGRVSAYVGQVTSEKGVLAENSVPYTVEMKEGERLATLINEIGGVSPWWDLQGIFVQREIDSPKGLMRIPVDWQQFLLEKDASQNIVLQEGDQVFIPVVVRRVFVAGSVKAPGAYTYVPGRITDAYIAQAGGMLLVADVDRSIIKRADGTVEPYAGTAEINNGDSIIILERIFKTWQDYFALVGTISGVILGLVGFYAAFTNFGR
jgi:protein involved in polysaccharide export with SLBB domain